MTRNLEKLKKNWESYIYRKEIADDTRHFVKEAWDRCIINKVDYNDGIGQMISKSELSDRLKENERLIKIAAPIMENIFEIIKQTSFSLILTDNEGVIIHLIESENIHFKHNRLNFVLGTRWDEINVGSNAIGTALARKEAVHMKGAEHYCVTHHPWTCSAALIRNSLGDIIGCLDISGSVEDDHIHTFGIVSTASKIIEKQLDLARSNELMDTAFNSVLEGLFVVDKDFEITHFNDKITEIFGVERADFSRIDMKKIFDDLDIVGEVFENGKNIRISDYVINYNQKKMDCLINISPTKGSHKITGAVIVIKEAYQVRKVVSQIAGFSSSYKFSDIITQNSQMIKTINFAKKIAKTDCMVLIQGESGTGKELFAHSIHTHSERCNGPFIAINCAALPKDLVESELFGYEKGAFTGASTEGKPGKFELANGGTMFLDEIGELPLEIQSKLLRVLDNRKVNRIGGRYERSLDVRIIVATNRDLRKEIEMKSFREDLYFRLNVINIKMIPLRDKKNDILLLADRFLEQFNKENKSEKKYFTEKFKESLLKNNWKGNIRELRHHIQREFYLSDDSEINGSILVEEDEIHKLEIKDENLQDVEKLCIIEALRTSNGNVVEASQRLNVGKSTIYRKIKSYEIDVKKFS